MNSGNCYVKSNCPQTFDMKDAESEAVVSDITVSGLNSNFIGNSIDIDIDTSNKRGEEEEESSGLFNGVKSSGKHLVLDIQDVENIRMLDNLIQVEDFFDFICETYDFHVLHKIEHVFQPQGFSLIYMLSESHISIHTFPERKYAAVDLYTCKQYKDDSVQEEIQKMFMKFFDAKRMNKIVLDRNF